MSQYSILILETLQTVDCMDRQILSNHPRGGHILADVQVYIHQRLGLLDRPSRTWLVRFLIECYPGLLSLTALNDALTHIEALEQPEQVMVL